MRVRAVMTSVGKNFSSCKENEFNKQKKNIKLRSSLICVENISSAARQE
jgi:hypothetical protein